MFGNVGPGVHDGACAVSGGPSDGSVFGASVEAKRARLDASGARVNASETGVDMSASGEETNGRSASYASASCMATSNNALKSTLHTVMEACGKAFATGRPSYGENMRLDRVCQPDSQ